MVPKLPAAIKTLVLFAKFLSDSAAVLLAVAAADAVALALVALAFAAALVASVAAFLSLVADV